MNLTREDVEHVAVLARLGLSEEEKQTLRGQLSSILDHIAVLERLDTDAISPTAQVNVLENVLRDDEVRPSLTQAQVLANAPRHRDGFLEVRAAIEAPVEGGDE
ncbi:MAG: Aspartyl-tRNA(Asn) amidotransferase subunit C @ Glutamyl-tRNA(Gln) amidotransferase subunit C [uncultured Thermomicrobiales bacterium]|uniref:Aspartyl/glutamyl-tRNA(Asn/Gln) amidotransferase subunit C n=1 Tax=uncultured Thermomicrobiales bacterium TaxID=1645740 RepID=A0A6J4VL14_9BACT|nr:MAG: Aspartyl-tRNA(Asn) amidotransferase subunit C @ Glutamyl-tRNA(Gln) amidotransferase subunit C [uncultured Thermomicrobiales bacterium]